MPKFIIEIWETRSFKVPVEAADEDEAKEIAEEDFAVLSISDEFVSVEVRTVSPA